MAERVACPFVAYSDTGSGALLNIDHAVRYEAAEAHAIVCKANTHALEDHRHRRSYPLSSIVWF